MTTSEKQSNWQENRLEKLWARAQDIFGDNLLDLGVSNWSLNPKSGDIDCVIITRKLDMEQVVEFIGDEPISVIPLNEAMWKTKFFNGKLVCMLYKGLRWYIGGNQQISKKTAKKFLKGSARENIYSINRAIISGKNNYKQAYDLAVQYLAIND